MNNYQKIKQEIKTATLVAVSKNRSISQIEELIDMGVTDFGENRVREFLDKWESLPDLNWHFIGQLQTNKVKYLIGKVSLIQSLDSLKLAEEIEKQSQKRQMVNDCLIQLKFDDQDVRGGVKLEELPLLYDYCLGCKHLRIRGFMVVAPLGLKKTKLNEVFHFAYSIYQDYQRKNKDMIYLSMGMSADYEAALECGSNMVRIGEKLFTKD